jgi:Family of unknown function (DUF6719)
MRQGAPKVMTASSIVLSGFVLAALVTSATAELVSREQDIADLRLGQRMLVDDGSCLRARSRKFPAPG